MLMSLRIENFAIVATLELDFAGGMNALTGETGAGKSIMIDALMLALGGRADATVVRKGSEKCDISALFAEPSEEAIAWLHAHDIAYDGEVVLRRIVSQEGRSKGYVNGQPLPLQKVKEFSEMLVHIHGQHEHQTLCQHTTHRIHLDVYANHHLLLQEVGEIYHKIKQVAHDLQSLQAQNQSPEQLQLIQYQIDELEALAPQADEITNLHTEHQRLQHACDYLQHIEHIKQLIKGDDTPTITQQLHQACQHVQALPQEDASIINLHELFGNALIQCEEAFDEIAQYAAHIHIDEERLQAVEQRMSALHQTARKYHIDVNQLYDHLMQLKHQRQQMESKQADMTLRQLDMQTLTHQFQQKALALRASRQQHAETLCAEISATIQQLAIPKGYVTMVFSALENPQPHGLDKVEYHVCTNPGMPLQPLTKIASGGELSRISLAIQMITAQRASTPTLLFDEVDVGIGGTTAALVGQLLRALGERLQVFCVTHQPQVAAFAHHHYKVTKETLHEQTYSHIKQLDQNQQIDELARMLGGLVITEQTRSHARELLAQHEMTHAV